MSRINGLFLLLNNSLHFILRYYGMLFSVKHYSFMDGPLRWFQEPLIWSLFWKISVVKENNKMSGKIWHYQGRGDEKGHLHDDIYGQTLNTDRKNDRSVV